MRRTIVLGLVLASLGGGAHARSTGFTWCRYVDDQDKLTFYSATFSSASSDNLVLRASAFSEYITRVHPEVTVGGASCNYTPGVTSYRFEAEKRSNEFSDQLLGFQMVDTQWKPDGSR